MTDDPNDMLQASHTLGGRPDANNELYRQWAATYDADVLSGGYPGLQVVGLMIQQAADSDAPTILDVGCGTGLVGRQLKMLIPEAIIIGADLSPEMAEVARMTGCYKEVFTDVDLNDPLPAELGMPFDIAVCCGAFSLGHVGTVGVENLVATTRTGGRTIFSVRRTHSLEEDFAGAVTVLRDRGLVEVDSWLVNAPYADEGADYWTLRTL